MFKAIALSYGLGIKITFRGRMYDSKRKVFFTYIYVCILHICAHYADSFISMQHSPD